MVLFIANIAWVNKTPKFDSILKPGTWANRFYILTFHAAITVSNIDLEMFACGSYLG